QRTGQVTFSDITTSDNSVIGRFRFTMGVDAQGVPLSPDTIIMPDFVNNLPADLVAAATRVLGQALSISTAAQLPPGIVPVGNSIITRRVLDLAEAGQRVQYGDPLKRVLPDLLRDWQGGRVPDAGFDSLLRTSDAGAEWVSILFSDMEKNDGLTGTARLLDRAPDLAGLGEQFVIASAGPGQLRADFGGTTNSATFPASSQPYALDYAGTNGEWAVTPYLSNAVFTWTFTNAPAKADMAVLIFGTNGQAQQLRWQVVNPPVTALYTFALGATSQQMQVDTNGDGTIDQLLSATPTTVNELPPALVAVAQDLGVIAGRAANPCLGFPNYHNYGTVVAVVYSKPMTQSSAGATNSYSVEGNNGADSVQIQPSGRVALLNLRKGISAIIPRKLSVTGVTDVRGNPLLAAPIPVQCLTPGTTNLYTSGVAVIGRVLKGDGSPAVGVPVTLTMYDGIGGGDGGCMSFTRRVSQVLTDSGGNFSFDYVMSGLSYTISASDTSTLQPAALQLILSSTIGDAPDAQELQQIINASSNPNSLLSLLSAGSLPQAVAIVQGLDRAVLHDAIGIGSGREGQTVPFVLRFRGRGQVTGQVVAADGVTPVANAAVNLFPDPNSMELGRGVFSDGTGQFAFTGIPLGVFSVQVATSDNRRATVVGLLNSPGQTTNVVISLPTNVVAYATVAGQVFDSDNITPVPNARVFLGHYNGATVDGVVAIVNADSTGSWVATNVPVQVVDVVAVTFDGTRKGFRKGVAPVANTTTYANVALQAATTVFGKVTFDNGLPATNALVAGGVALVRSDVNGDFQLQGVPVGSATISAGLERDPAAGIDFPRLGSASLLVVEGAANYVVVKLRPAGRIFGKVFDAQGRVQGGIRVAIPQEGGFYWTVADTNGNYVFENLGLGGYTLSAPANAVTPQLNESDLQAQISSGNEQQIMAAFNEAISVFVGANDPLVNGDQLKFRPSSWGFTSAKIVFDGQNVNADIKFIVQGSVSGTVLNGQGVPIGAEVRLTGLGPDINGNPVMTIRGDATSDPATGAFGFTNVLLAGPFGLQSASPFYPVIISTNGFTTPLTPDATGIILQFPPVNDVNGSIAGHVFNPDGTPVGDGVKVSISVSSDYQIQTDTNGFFATQTEFPAIDKAYTVQAFDPSTGLKGKAVVGMVPGITNFIDVHMLSRNSLVQVTVLQASGAPAPGAQVELDQGSYPNDAPLFGLTDTNGVVTFPGLWEGTYSVSAQFTEQSTKLFARAGATAGPNQTALVTLRLGATGSVKGTFVAQDLVTPVYGAEVAIGNLGFATTDTNGFFEFDGVPVGSYQIVSSDPVSGGYAVTSATITYNGQTQTVQLVEVTLGTVSGWVLDPYNRGFVPGATVSISFSDGLTPTRTATTDPTGAFKFPGSPPGAFNLNAFYFVPGAQNLKVYGQANGTLSATETNVSVSIQLQPLSYLAVHVVRDDRVTPAVNTTVTVGNQQQDTSTNGDVFFSNLAVPGSYQVTAISQRAGDVFNGVQTNVLLSARGTNPAVTLVLPGVGNVVGTVVGSDGSTPINNAQVILAMLSPLFGNQTVTALTDPQGRFAFSDVALGPFLVTAASVSLGASENGTLTAAGQTNQVKLQLGPSGTLLGVVVRADGVTPVPDIDLAIDYNSQSANPGKAVFHTGPDGAFRFDHVPVGSINVSAADPSFDGIIDFTTFLTNNGQVLNLGNVPFDELIPAVVQVTPPDTTINVPITNFVELLFNKPLDTNSIDPSGIFIRGTNGNVASTVTLLPDTNGVLDRVRIQPLAPLKSKNVYSVFVLSGDLLGATGGLIGSGPRDLVGRTLAATFVSSFATADNTPPQLLSMFPSNNAVQIDPSAVPRLAFDKTLNATTFVFNVTGPSGPVAGASALGLNGQVISFVPTVNLQPNASYSMVISNVIDLAGNRATGEPFRSTFATIDTIGPVIASLQIASNTPPAAGAI
ncbi:MAG TPA: carboxypeptidase regulatory-like domain-containing protein, partial [Verrucomicrobiae bacterium]|nr:carboxypeptidase regulatory-like domain-containing protein [Verrucomicrobiae bacterium]